MEQFQSVIVLDRNMRRRAAFCRKLLTCGKQVEPFEDISDLKMIWPGSGLIFAHDESETIAELIDHMCVTGTWLAVIGFAENPSPRRVSRAILQGAIDYVAWPCEETELAETLGTARQRAKKLGGARMRETVARSRIGVLTRREREVLNGVASGMSNRRIGEKLGISPRTVEIHRYNLINKMGVKHTSEAIRIAVEASLVN